MTTTEPSTAPAIEHLDPDGLPHATAFTNVVTVSGPVKTVYVGGQNAVDADGAIVGDDLAAQAAQVFANLSTALSAAGAGLADVVKWTVYVVDGHAVEPAFGVFQQVWGTRPNPPSISFVKVAELARPDALVEIEAIAVVPVDPAR